MTSFMGGGRGRGRGKGEGGGEGEGTTKADVFLVELRNGGTVLVEADSISCPVAKVMGVGCGHGCVGWVLRASCAECGGSRLSKSGDGQSQFGGLGVILAGVGIEY